MERRQSNLIRAQLQTLIADSKSQSIDEETEAVHEADVVDFEHRGRPDIVVARGGRRWCIVVDTCFGHSSSKLSIVPGIGRLVDDPDSDLELESHLASKARLRGILHSAVRKTRLMGVVSTLLTAGQAPTRKDKDLRRTMVQRMDEVCENDPSLKIPVFGPTKHAPSPVVEVDEEHEDEKLQRVQQKRTSEFFVKTSAESISHGDDTTCDELDALAITVRSQDDDADEDDEDDAQLLEGFGNRPEKRSVLVRKFVRRNKFLKKVFGGKKTNSNQTDQDST